MTPQKKSNQKRGLLYFLVLAIAVFVLLLLFTLYTRTRSFLAEEKDIAQNAYHDLEGAFYFLQRQDFKKAEFLFQSSAGQTEALINNPLFSNRSAYHNRWRVDYLDTLQELIDSGKAIAGLGVQITDFIEKSRRIPELFLAQIKIKDKSRPARITPLLRERANQVGAILKTVATIEKKLKNASSPFLPAGLREKLTLGQKALQGFRITLQEIQKNFTAVFKLLGDPLPHRYLILLQNQNELRATGGFIGSYVILDMNRGQVTKIDFKDIYDSDGQLDTLLPPPPGIDVLTDHYAMRDANYSPDFPTSAKQIVWFLEHSRGPSIDTVIALDQSVIEDLLGITGPISLGYAGLSVDGSNFSTTLSYLVESKVISHKQPKQILGELIPNFFAGLRKIKDYKALLSLVQNAIMKRHIQAYSNDPGIQRLVQSLHLDGGLIPAQDDTDFLALVSTSIAGNKSDRSLRTTIQHKTRLESNGTWVNEVVLHREHRWSQDDLVPIDRLWRKLGSGQVNYGTLIDLLGRGAHRDFLRLYVPKGSQFLEVHGIDVKTLRVSEDLGYTVFAFQRPPLAAGTQDDVLVRYRLPFKISASSGGEYRFIVQKQAGAENHQLQHILEWPVPFVSGQNYPQPTTQGKNRVVHEVPLNHNRFFITVLGK